MSDRSPFDDHGRADARREESDRFRTVCIRRLKLLHRTDAALLVRGDGDEGGDDSKKTWIPISQVKRIEPPWPKLETGDDLEIEIPQWLAQEKEFYFE